VLRLIRLQAQKCLLTLTQERLEIKALSILILALPIALALILTTSTTLELLVLELALLQSLGVVVLETAMFEQTLKALTLIPLQPRYLQETTLTVLQLMQLVMVVRITTCNPTSF
jgi:hypothetical protein